MKKSNIAFICVVAAAVLWGIVGIFVNNLSALGFSSMQIVTLRSFFALLTSSPIMFAKGKKMFRVKKRDIWVIICAGVIGMFMATSSYFIAMEKLQSFAIAAVLMYSSPAFVLIFSAILFKEKITKKKFISLILMIAGCIFVCGVIGSTVVFSAEGLLFAVASGITFASYSIFSRLALNRGYHPITIAFYSFVLVFLCSLPFSSPVEIVMNFSPQALFWGFCIGFFSYVLANSLYTKGLAGMESGRVSIISTLEPLIATLVGVLLYDQKFTVSTFLGILFMMTGIIVMSLDKDRQNSIKEKE